MDIVRTVADLRTRVGAWPGPVPAGAMIELRDGAALEDQPALAVMIGQGPATVEFAWPPARVALGPPDPGPAGSSEALAPEPASHPLGLPLLGLALAVLTWAGLALGRAPGAGQGIRAAGR